MPNCSICGTPIDKLPNWLDDVEINYRCALCAEATAHQPIAHDDDDEETKDAKGTVDSDDDGDDEEEEEEEED